MYSTYEQCTKITYQALDLLNVKQFLKKDTEPRDILWAIEDYIDDGDGEEVWAIEEFMKKYPQVFGNPPEIFNYIGQDEFIEYCIKRYPEVRWGHEVIERFWVADDGHNANN